MDLSIALVNWNNRDYLQQCLESIEAAGLPLVYEIVVSDNGSTDGSLEMLAERFPDVKVVQNGRNVGVARGNNQCIRHSSGRYIYILNPDGTLQASFCYFPTLWEEFLLVTHIGMARNPYFPAHNGTWPQARPVDWISSASIVVRRSAIEQIGLVDEDYFIYSDETDWQYRLWQAGWPVHYLPTVTTIHFGGGSFQPGGRRYTLVYRGRMLFARKHYGPLYSYPQRGLFAIAAAGRIVIWSCLYFSSKWRKVAQRQIASNLETLRLCFQLR